MKKNIGCGSTVIYHIGNKGLGIGKNAFFTPIKDDICPHFSKAAISQNEGFFLHHQLASRVY